MKHCELILMEILTIKSEEVLFHHLFILQNQVRNNDYLLTFLGKSGGRSRGHTLQIPHFKKLSLMKRTPSLSPVPGSPFRFSDAGTDDDTATDTDTLTDTQLLISNLSPQNIRYLNIVLI
jgi:hypothetical protein